MMAWLAAALVATAGTARVRVEHADALPPRTFTLPAPPAKVVAGDALFAAFAPALRADLEDLLAKVEFADPSAEREVRETLADLATLEGRTDDASAELKRVAALQRKRGPRAATGVLQRAALAARGAPQRSVAFRAALDRELAGLPFSAVRGVLADWRGWTEIWSQAWLEDQLRELPQDPAIARDTAQRLVWLRFARTTLVPLREEIRAATSAVLAAHPVEQRDIWSARDVVLPRGGKLAPVHVAIWDSGVDVSLFKSQLWTNPHPGRDGWPNDLHGLAYDQANRKQPQLLVPLPRKRAEVLAVLLQGYSDLKAGLASDQAMALRKTLAEMPSREEHAFLYELSTAILRAHGTAVASIALSGNPAARLMVGRLDEVLHALPSPYEAWAKRQGTLHAEAIAWFRRHGARVVNMSWGFAPHEFEDALEESGFQGSPDERRTLAHKLWKLVTDPLRDAIAAASDVLFVAAAGNADVDARFEEFVPSAFSLPNLITVGAVDEAGEETSFTSYGSAQLYAKGLDVPAKMPGGIDLRCSGTSFAAPMVTGLAAKLFAVAPALTPQQVRNVLIETAEERKTSEGRTLRLVHGKRALEKVRAVPR